MRIRSGFVSNSSSASYIVTFRGERDDMVPEGELCIPNDKGESCFGWSPVNYHDFYSKLNFAFCQLLYICSSEDLSVGKEDSFPPKEGTDAYECYSLFIRVLEDNGIKPVFVMTEKDARDHDQFLYGMSVDLYIDHQSSAIENMNMEMFYSYDDMYDFLFVKDSYIHTDNDN